MARQQPVLIFDADDTLWESNLLFQRALESFVTWMAGHRVPDAQVRATFGDTEREYTRRYGYGAAVFVRSLHATFERVRGRPVTSQESAHIGTMVDHLLRHAVEPMPGVVETLGELSPRNRLMLLTKGIEEEQQAKIDVSGLAHFFGAITIVAEKDAATYRDLIAAERLQPEAAWMIGNSPKSDINPARAAGLGAVFIPNPHTWALEHDDIDHADDRILQLTSITELTTHF